MAAILDSEITKMPSGCNHYTRLILKLHGIETPKMQRNDCYQTLQGSLCLWTINISIKNTFQDSTLTRKRNYSEAPVDLGDCHIMGMNFKQISESDIASVVKLASRECHGTSCEVNINSGISLGLSGNTP